MRFFTSDHHFGHQNILKFMSDTRKFVNTDRMREVLIENWNAAISQDDEVFVLGDFAFKEYEFQNIMPRLNGRKWLVTGNHDPHFHSRTCPLAGLVLREDPCGLKTVAKGNLLLAAGYLRALGFEDAFLNTLIEIPGIGKVMLSHFPYWPTKPEETPAYDLRCEQQRPLRGDHVLLLHGHVHSKTIAIKDDNGLMLDIGVDAWGMRPVSEAEIVDLWGKYHEQNSVS